MQHISDIYKEAFDKHGDSPSSVLWPKGRQDDRFHALTKNIGLKKSFSILDFGCGLAHLKDFVDKQFAHEVSYTGIDLLEDFLIADKLKYPLAHFMSTESLWANQQNYDYILASGTFNILYTDNPVEHSKIIFETLNKLFQKTNVYLAVNFMTDQVDYVQKGAYHQNVIQLYEYVTKNLSRRFEIDKSYMPYEYTMTIWKDDSFLGS